MHLRRTSGLFWIGSLWLLGGCGPVAIGAAVSSGRGGTRTVQVETPQVDVDPASTAAGREITLRWRLIQSQGRRVRLSLAFASPCHGNGPIPAQFVRFTQAPDANGAETELAADGDGAYTLAGAGAPGVVCRAVWRFADQFGVGEVRGVDVTLRYVDEERTDLADNKQLLTAFKLGSAAPTLANLTLTRRNANVGGEESPLDCRFEATDPGGDDGWRYDLEYRETSSGAWKPLRQRPVVSTRTLDCPVTRYVGDVAIDPLGEDLPFGRYPEFGVRLRAHEGDLTSAWIEAQTTTTFGLAPQITRVTVPNPNSNQSSLAEPRFQLPITLEVVNRSARQVEVLFRAEYSINAGPRRALTLARAGEPGTAERIVMGAGESRVHYLIWNVVADEGLGIPIDDPQATPQLARVFVRGEIVDNRAPERVLGEWRASDDTSQLYTSPFVNFQSALQEPAERLVSAGVSRSQRTRDIFYSRLERRGPLNARAEWIAAVDQTFAPIRIPGLGDYDIYNTLGAQHGIIDIYPTDLVPNAPDCLVRLARNENPFYHFAWNAANQGPTVEPIPLRTGGLRSGSGRVEMSVPLGQNQLPAVVFHGGDDITSGDLATLHLIGVARNEAASPRWRATTQPFTAQLPRKASGASYGPRPNFRVIGGDFDGDQTTTELFVGHEGIERASGAAPGFFDVFRVQANASGDLGFTVQSPRAVPLPPPAPGADRDTDYWDLCEWPNPVNAAQPGILLVRSFAAANPLPRVHTFDLLRQDLAGGFASATWERLGELSDSEAGGKTLLHACALDLDASIGGSAEPELIVMFARRAPALLDVRLRVMAAGSPVWRRTLANMPTSKVDADRYDRGQMVDVNGDDFPDLVVRQTDPGAAQRDSSSGYYAIASSLTGVAGGLSEVAVTASNTPSRQPAAGDFNLDGYADVISRGILHLGQPNGAYAQAAGIGPASPSAAYVARRVFEVGRRDPRVNDLVTFDADGTSSVQRFESVNRQVVPGATYPVTVSGGGALRALIPFVQAGRTGAADRNDLAAIVGDGAADNRLHRATFDGTQFRAEPWPNFSQPVMRDLTLLRTGDLTADEETTNPQQPHSIAVARPATNQVVLFNALASPSLSSRLYTVGSAAESILRMASASATEDRREDLLVLTLEGSRLVRLYCLPQAADGTLGTPRLFLQFDDWDGADFRGIGFNPTGVSLAQGIVLFRTGLRIVLPLNDSGSVRAAMIRTELLPAQQLGLSEVGLQVTDFDRDGQIEIIGGGELSGSALRLLKVDRAYRR